MSYWLIRSPYKHRGWDDALVRGVFQLYGIRSPEACSNIRKMKPSDRVLYYHSRSGRALFGVMTVVCAPYPDPTSAQGAWLAVDCTPEETFLVPVKLSKLRRIEALADCPLLTRPRLSVARLSAKHFKIAMREGAQHD